MWSWSPSCVQLGLGDSPGGGFVRAAATVVGHLAGDLGLVPPQQRRQDPSNALGGAHARVAVEQAGARPAGQHIIERAGHLEPDGMHRFGHHVRQAGHEGLRQRGVLDDERLHVGGQ